MHLRTALRRLRPAAPFLAGLSLFLLLCRAQAAEPATPLPAVAAAASAPAAPRPVTPPNRPRIGLVLSGGGARGIAHVGVLKVLEREHIPVDVIAGTSMGAIIGGLYASGMSAEDIERELLKVNWDGIFASRVARQELSQRRKEEDYEVTPALEIGLRNGEIKVPLGTVSSRGLEMLLRRYTLPVRDVRNFDELPIPFRAVATDMESGEARVLGVGDLALALRSSMSIPGVFTPTDVNERVLGDGGLVDNLPVDVARAMGADIIIAVNIGTPLAGRESLDSLLGVTRQMISILTEQNVRRSLALLTPRDLLIAPHLGNLTSADFDKTPEFINAGELQALAQLNELRRLALSDEGYAQWTAARPHTEPPPAAVLKFVEYEGSQLTNPKRFEAQMESQPGQPFDAARAERDARRLAGTGDYLRSDYQLVSTPQGDGLVFELEDKPWGPNYFRVGLDMATDFRGRGSFNIKIAHNRHWLDDYGGEWRNNVQIGSEPRWYSEWYHPLNWTTGVSNDWFVSTYGEVSRREFQIYSGNNEVGRYRHTLGRVGVDLGQPWGRWGELRMGLVEQVISDTPEILASTDPALNTTTSSREGGARLGLVVDQLDYAYFPQAGYRFNLAAVLGRQQPVNSETRDFKSLEGEGLVAGTWGSHTLTLLGRWQQANAPNTLGYGRYTLGGFQQLSGYQPGQIEGNYLAFGRLSYYARLTPPALTRGFFAGATLEAGNAWGSRSQVSLHDLRYGMSLFLGADTGIGPLYLGLGYAPKGTAGVYLVLGRP
ncbi:MAG TPA: patatin-like phospholipase family protein [Methylibium sp.]